MSNRQRRRGGTLARLFRGDDGQDLIEYALLTCIVATAGALLLPVFLTTMRNAYTTWNSNAQAAWEAPPPM
jgi:Flp pilus assembly pilin Flp